MQWWHPQPRWGYRPFAGDGERDAHDEAGDQASQSYRGCSVLVVVVADGRGLRLLTDAFAGLGHYVGQLQPG